MRLVIIAPPGAGKGTQSARIAAHYGIPHIAVGTLLRSHVELDTRLGRSVRGYMDRGALVPDRIVLKMVRQALADAKANRVGYVLDGFPRTRSQARAAYTAASELEMTADVALHLQVDDAEAVRRMLARAAVEHRPDDAEPVIRRRLALYHQMTQPVLDGYAERGILRSVDGTGTPEEVTASVLELLDQVQANPPVDAALLALRPVLA
ncbi:adenylate kinase [Dactylosporangium darangshiense]|uniref:Adenylate kinase n=1 Tax=Dactylosporangium darangshiense TaxID=579108 RepID=A0ABP8DIK2_9ACTN